MSMEHSDPVQDRGAAVLQLRLTLEHLLDDDRTGQNYESLGVNMPEELPHKLDEGGILHSQELGNNDCKPVVGTELLGRRRSGRYRPVNKDEVAVLRSMLALLGELQQMQAGVRERAEAYSMRHDGDKHDLEICPGLQDSACKGNLHGCCTLPSSMSDAAAVSPNRMPQASVNHLLDHDHETCRPMIRVPKHSNLDDTELSEGVLAQHTACEDVHAILCCNKTNLFTGVVERERDGAIAALSEAMDLITEAEDKAQAASAMVKELQRENSDLKSELAQARAELDATRRQSEEKAVAQKLELSSQRRACSMAEEGYKLQQAEVLELSTVLSKQESLMESLHTQLQELLEERSFERELQLQQVEQLQAELAQKIIEKNALMEQLDKAERELQSKSKHVEELESHTRAVRQHYSHVMTTSEGDLRQLRDDNLDLKRRLVRLIKDKDRLWHKADMLVSLQREKAEVRWMPDEEVTRCLNCGTPFSFTLRKHHCRLCGRIFCTRCANNWIMTVSSRRKVRICNACFIEQTDKTFTSSDALSTTTDAESDGQEDYTPAATAAVSTVTEPVSIVRSMKRWLRTSLSTPSSATLSRSQSSVEASMHSQVPSRCLSNPVLMQSSSPAVAMPGATSCCFEDSYEEITDIDVAELTACVQASTVSASKRPKAVLPKFTFSPPTEDRPQLSRPAANPDGEWPSSTDATLPSGAARSST